MTSREDIQHAGAVLDAVQSPSRAAQSPVAASWCRSALRHGLDPSMQVQRERIGAAELASLRQAHDLLLTVASPVLDQLFRSVGRSGCGVILSDANGIILERRASDADAPLFSLVGLAPGGRWGEEEEGTNGIGTCLFEDRPVVIHRDQHFASRNIGISCMDAPVHDPHGRLVAALDVSSCRDDHGVAMADMVASLVQETARHIERDYFCRHFGQHRIIFLGDDPATGTALLAVDRDDMVIGASRGARLRYRLTDEMLGGVRPLTDVMGQGGEGVASFHDGERAVLRRALAQADGNASRAAQMLGIGRATLYRRMKRAGIRA